MVFGKHKNTFVLLVVKNSIFFRYTAHKNAHVIWFAKIKRECKFVFC